ncbi:MAG TPA: GDSL-type esterase/lipase family protein [Thermoanaerobaculia bacterium]|nr:GDSL-type esterase/lipase family protein [Thermoanaerobaculia bacterium]
MTFRKALLLPLLLAAALPWPAVAQKTYFAFGDSITAGLGDDPARPPEQAGYPGRLQMLLANAGSTDRVENHGLGAEDTSEGVTRIETLFPLVSNGDVMMIMEGTNDITRGISPETTAFNLNQMAIKCRRQGVDVMHATLIPRLPNARVDENNLINQQTNGLIRNLAGIQGRPLVDPFEIFTQQTDLFDRLYADILGDPVGHPNSDGYDLLAQTFFNVITGVDRVPPVTGVVRPANGSRGIRNTAPLEVEVWDFGTGIDLGATSLVVNGEVVPATITGDARHLQINYQSPQPWRGAVTVALRSRDLASPPNSVDRDITRFRIAGSTLLDGDLNEDGRVDGTDLVLLGVRFGAIAGNRRYDFRADFNNDGIINGMDLAILAANFGRSSF